MTTEAPITVRDVLRLLLDADSYPRLGNYDWREAEPRADDPPEFARRLVALREGSPRHESPCWLAAVELTSNGATLHTDWEGRKFGFT